MSDNEFHLMELTLSQIKYRLATPTNFVSLFALAHFPGRAPLQIKGIVSGLVVTFVIWYCVEDFPMSKMLAH